MSDTPKKERKPISELNRLFFDCETGGLDFVNDPLVEVAWVLTDPSGKQVIIERAFKVFPHAPVSPEAAAINGYDPEVWEREAVPLRVALEDLTSDSKDAVFVAHNIGFDWPFVYVALEREHLQWNGDYHRICTCALAWPLLHRGEVEGVALKKLAAHFGIAQPGAHRALSDARTCREIYLKLMERFA